MLSEQSLASAAYLTAATRLLQRARTEHPTKGVWEAADLQWWWRKPRATDSWRHPFWFDASGEPVAAAVVTDWGGRIGLDILVVPSSSAELIEEVWHRGLAVVTELAPPSIEVMVDDDDDVMRQFLVDAGFVELPDKGVSAWMTTEDRPPGSPASDGYSLATRVETSDAPHHFIARNGPGVAERLQQTWLYQPGLDLVMLDRSGEVAAYGLFWFDPATKVGFVEPMRTKEEHRRKGLARHLLISGITGLIEAGATRVKINYEQATKHPVPSISRSDSAL